MAADTIELRLAKYGPKIVRVLPSAMQSPDALQRIMGQVALACTLTPALLKCDPKTVVFGVYKAARLGLDISGASGQAYLIPFKGKASLVIGYKGLVTMACRATGTRSIRGVVVHEGEPFEYVDGLAPILRHSPHVGRKPPEGTILCAYAVATWPDGSTAWKVAPGWYLERVADESKARAGDRSTPWDDHLEEMIAKTAVRYLCKGLDLSPDIARHIEVDARATVGDYLPEQDPEWTTFDDAPPEQSRQAEMAGRLQENSNG